MAQSVAEILNGAADYLEKYGWEQFTLFHGDMMTPSCCAGGAIVAAENPTIPTLGNRIWRGYDVLGQSTAAVALAASLPDVGCPEDAAGTIANWNDDPSQTIDTVVAKLREVAAANA